MRPAAAKTKRSASEEPVNLSGGSLEDVIRVRGARQHNLKNVDVTIPRNKMVVFTGVSGSGKSSLAFDTIFAEGQRRYVESLSAYARQFLGQVDKPDVDAIEGLSPAISIDQKSTSHNPRSTVGTVTEIQDYLRLLFGRAGDPHCPQCDRAIRPQTIDEMVDQIRTLPEGTRYQLLAPVVRGKKGTHSKLISGLAAEGFARVRINGEVRELADNIELDKNTCTALRWWWIAWWPGRASRSVSPIPCARRSNVAMGSRSLKWCPRRTRSFRTDWNGSASIPRTSPVPSTGR